MLIRHFLILGISLMTTTVFAQTQSQEFLDYIKKYADLAIDEMERAGIPASIKLAQGLLESNAGRSYLARKGNNHFGIKCGGNWEGKKVFREDDDFDENGKLIKSCFRSYRNVRASYIAHSDFLRDPKKTRRYGFLFRLDPTDYRRWARGLKSAGYATSATYDKKLIRLIETYELHKYDTEVTRIDPDTDILVENKPRKRRTDTSTSPRVNSVNDVRFLTAMDGESVVDISERSQTSVSSLKKYNEKITDSNQRLKAGTRVFLQPKRNAYRGKRKEHKIETGETMYALSQRYGVKLSKLYKRNKMAAGQEPAVGAIIVLKGKVKKRPPLSTEPIQEEEELILEDPETEEVTNPAPTETIPEKVPELEEPVIEPTPTAPKPEPETPKPQPPVLEDPEPEIEEIEFEEEDIFEEEEEEELLDPIEPPAPPANPKEPFQPEKEETEPAPTPEQPAETAPEQPKEEVTETPEPPKETVPANAVFYTVQRGDTLWGIARKFNSTVADIKRWNNLDSNYIRRGMRFRVK